MGNKLTIRRDSIWTKKEQGLLGRELNTLPNHIMKLTHSQIRRHKVLLLVDVRDIRSVCFFADHRYSIGVFRTDAFGFWCPFFCGSRMGMIDMNDNEEPINGRYTSKVSTAETHNYSIKNYQQETRTTLINRCSAISDSPRGCSSLNDFPATMIELYVWRVDSNLACLILFAFSSCE